MESRLYTQLPLQGVGMENAETICDIYKNHFEPLVCIKMHVNILLW